MTVLRTVQTMGPRTLRRVGGLGVDGDDRGLVRRTFGVLTRRTWVTVVTVRHGGTPSSCPYESCETVVTPGVCPGGS